MPDTALVVMARYPEVGTTKTRLARIIGDEEAVRLYRAFLTDLAQRFAGQMCDLHWAYTPAGVDYQSFIATLAPSLLQHMRSFPQQGADLGARLHHVFRWTYDRDYQRIIVISSDSPHLSLDTVARAREALDEADVVLGPADDGGYYLIAMRRPYDVFRDIPMSTSLVLQMTIELAYRQGLRVRTLEKLFDVDELPDLLQLVELLQADSSLAPATATCLATIKEHQMVGTNRAGASPAPTIRPISLQSPYIVGAGLAPALPPAPTLPRSIYIEPTSRCNELCQQCPRTLLSREDDRDLSFDDFRSIVDQFPVLERVVLHGLGEPLLNKDLPRMIRYLKERGTYVLFNSNGILLNAKRGQELIEAGLDEYRLSMDGATRESYARVRGVDAFDKIWRNIRSFVALQREQQASKPAVSLWFTAMKENLHELPALIVLAYEYGIREIYLQRLVYFESGLAHSKQALFRRSTREELELVRRCEEMCKQLGISFNAAGSATPLESLIRDFGDRPWSGCQRPYTLTYITSSGNVLSCCFAPFGHKNAREYQEERVLGNVFQEPIEAIWRGERYEAFRRAFESDHPAKHCSQCGLNWSY